MGLFGGGVTPYKNQKYEDLKKAATASGHPFIDMEFQPDGKALFADASKSEGIIWKRPKDIVAEPKLFVDGVSAHDLNQGELGNCWFVAACSCLAVDKDIWHKVIPDHKEQEWNPDKPEKYCGIFHFHFWRYGEWVDVVIDDFLPTRDGKLVYVHSKDKNEFWSALIEKAYAKLFGSYEALDGGELAEALEDFTGGVAEPIELRTGPYSGAKEKQDELFEIMKTEMDHRSLMAAAIPAQSKDEMETSNDVGLVIGHAYGITAVKRVAIAGTGFFNMFNQDKLAMVRLRNPWGGHEWKGAFSDGSEEWDKIGQDERKKLGLTFDDDGEFWMLFDDFMTHFTNLSICRQVNTSFFSLQKTWRESAVHGEWKTPNRAGGCINNKDTVLQNPQFVFDITADKEDECLFALTQKAGRSAGSVKETIGFTIMKVEENRCCRVHRLLDVVKSSDFKNSRTMFVRHVLQKGRYVLICSTFEAMKEAEFLLRVYTGSDNDGQLLVRDKPAKGCLSSMFCCFPCCKYPVQVTKVKVIRAVGLERQDVAGGADPYILIRSEGENHTTAIVKDSTTPEWNTAYIFYRAHPNKPIKIDVWNHNIVRDTHLGRHLLNASGEMKEKIIEVDLYDRKKTDSKVPGKLFLQVSSSNDLQMF